MKDFGRQVLGFIASRNTVGNEGVNALKILLVQFREMCSLALRRLNQQPLIRFTFQRFQCFLPRIGFLSS